MNAVEIEEAISALAEQPFDAETFPFAFLEAFGAKATTIKRLKSGSTNKSDLGGVLQTNNIHFLTAPELNICEAMAALKASPATVRAKAKFILATDGADFQAENLASGEVIVCDYADFPDHFGFFLPLAGISTVKQITESAFDIKATGRLNRLYLQLLKDNPDWGTADRRHDMNHFMARLIFCFFAEDTDIFGQDDLFTGTIERMSAADSSNTHEVIGALFRAMNTSSPDRAGADIPRWANALPYVNGGLFSDSLDVPRFSRAARSYLLHIGKLDWKRINPDIFGSMIQAVADDEERGKLGMHYTSVPNILKVLNPLFLDDLWEKLEEAGDNARKLLNLRNRMARIRVFDPACGSGNFLVIAYKQMRAIEAEINERRGEADRRTGIPLTNFRGIEIRDFPAEIARLALIIAEYQCDVLYRGQKEALAEFLPLDAMNWITCGNALRLDWLSICPPTGTGTRHSADDLFHTPLDQAEIDFENEGGETYICGNPPYLGSTWQNEEQKFDLEFIFKYKTKKWKSLDYVSGWFMKAVNYMDNNNGAMALVATNSICQGRQVSILWPLVFDIGQEIIFAHTNFRWTNLARYNAGVTVVIVGIGRGRSARKLFSLTDDGHPVVQSVPNINAYLIAGPNIVVDERRSPPDKRHEVKAGGKPVDGGNLLLNLQEKETLCRRSKIARDNIRRVFGANEFNRGCVRYALWFVCLSADTLKRDRVLSARIDGVRKMRLDSDKRATVESSDWPHLFQEIKQTGKEVVSLIPVLTSERRAFIPVGLEPSGTIITNLSFAQFDGPMYELAVLNSRMHFIWISAVCGKFKTDYRYSSTLGWNTFSIPKMTEKNRGDLARCAAEILLVREAHFPATIADLYDPEKMPADLRTAHDRNDDVLERIYIGRRFRNDTERLEHLFDLYVKMTEAEKSAGAA